jgi:hypothetical protein
MSIAWLRSALICNDKIVCRPLNPEAVGDADLRDVCFRMHIILGTIEQNRCEGRVLPRELFDRMDTLESLLFHGPTPHLAEWVGLISDFGDHYAFDGRSSVVIAPAEYQDTCRRFQRGSPHEA